MVRIGKKVEGKKYTKRVAAYAIIKREEDNKIGIATDGEYFFLGGGLEGEETEEQALRREVAEPIEKDHKVLWINANDYKEKLYHEYQRYILKEYIKSLAN